MSFNYISTLNKGTSCHWAGAGLSLGQGRAALMAAGAAAIGLQLALLASLRMPRFASASAWVRRTGAILAGAALVATAWSLVPVVATTLCL